MKDISEHFTYPMVCDQAAKPCPMSPPLIALAMSGERSVEQSTDELADGVEQPLEDSTLLDTLQGHQRQFIQ
ncbi:hypothetical protein GCM10007160_17640 [Litchfieldella qijiaojingensis]|uniref:Uncharacterized protein n=1 Tax=Litchfieldella qijiaojingensis TaxID=980347 RepID=A0ABQ2YNZ9_9GAMM|nr:hypothetical protein GCM10007160_17640 [Halomonas qijiaojingensis]